MNKIIARTKYLGFTEKELLWIKTFSDMAKLMASHSTCARMQVGSLVTIDNRIITTGYNGTPSGMKHCCETFKGKDMSDPKNKEEHGKFSILYELHAEQNAIAYAGKHNISIDGGTMYVTLEPCTNCAKLIKAAGITKVYYSNKYDRENDGPKILDEFGISCIYLGDIISLKTKKPYYKDYQ